MMVPDVFQFSNYRTFLTAFLAENKKRSPAFSHRMLARKLGWPTAYLSDVIAYRKSFTMARAIQFARFTQMGSAETQRLILLSLKEDASEVVREYFETHFQTLASERAATE